MKKALVFLGVCGVLCMVWALSLEVGPYRNARNARNLHKGFSAQEVVIVMGKPHWVRDSYFAPGDDSTFMYIYKNRFASSGNIELYLTKSDSTLCRIVTHGS